jgi:hypothetical protein
VPREQSIRIVSLGNQQFLVWKLAQVPESAVLGRTCRDVYENSALDQPIFS